MDQTFSFPALGFIQSPYKQKFAIPRQPGLIPEASGELVLHPPFADDAMVRGIEAFSHARQTDDYKRITLDTQTAKSKHFCSSLAFTLLFSRQHRTNAYGPVPFGCVAAEAAELG